MPDGATVDVDVELESLSNDGIVVTATVARAVAGECRRCLGPAGGELDASRSQELFEPRPADDGETYPLEGDQVDLEPRASATPCCSSCPWRRLCATDCPGLCPTCGADRNEGACDVRAPSRRDPRWAALDELRESGHDRRPGRFDPSPAAR